MREPLANIIAQTNEQNAQRRRREIQDSHYATVSDDSGGDVMLLIFSKIKLSLIFTDEMYAAIEDPNLYTSGSETYAQIAPMTVSVEINPTAPLATQQPSTSQSTQSTARFSRTHQVNPSVEDAPVATVEALKNLHSRQASSSSCTSSVGIIGSPKPEKRQANSPLPPTPKSRNSTSSVMEYHEGAKLKDSNNNSSKLKQSPSKDLEGMYAKVMKKNKLSSVPSENSSPVLPRHDSLTADETDSVVQPKTNQYETIDKRNRSRNISDAGYETIPADRNNNSKEPAVETATHYAQITEKSSKVKMSLFKKDEARSVSDAKYEKVEKKETGNATDSDQDPNYEIVISKNNRSSSSSSTLVDDGYTQIEKKKMSDVSDDESIPGYSTIRKPEPDYSSIGAREKPPLHSITDVNIYSSIPTIVTPSPDSISSELFSTTNSLATPTTVNNNNYESLDTSEETTLEEPNYESMKYLKENPYEQLQNSSPDPSADAVSPLSDTKNPVVDDFFKV